LAVVSLEPASQEGLLLVQLARGPSRTQLVDTKLFGPYEPSQAEAALRALIQGLLADGYLEAGAADRLEALASGEPRTRARAAINAGWRREVHSVEALIALAQTPKEEIASVVEALGRIGDPRAIPVVREEAGRKLLSRRRAGVEALRMLGDAEGLADACNQAVARLPASVQSVLQSLDDMDASRAPLLVDAVAALPFSDQGLALDTLYELGTPLTTTAARTGLVASDIARPKMWRYAKSVLKRAMVRLDGPTVGALLHRIELASRETPGSSASLKSGYDGKKRTVRVFSRKTVDYLRRSAWRWLLRIARHAPGQYAHLAAHVLAPYRDVDDVIPRKRVPRTGHSYLLHRVLMHRSKRFVYDGRRTCFRWRTIEPVAAPSGVREEAFPELWDAEPRAYLTVLAHGGHSLALQMAVGGLQRHAGLLGYATDVELAAMIGQPLETIVELASKELRRRFRPDAPDFHLLQSLIGSENPAACELGLLFLRDAAHVWTRDPDRSMALLTMGSAVGREAASRLLVVAVPALPSLVRTTLASRILQAVRVVPTSEQDEALSTSLIEVARALADDIVALVDLDGALALIAIESDAAAAVAALVLERAEGGLDALGVDRVMQLASSPRAARRRVAVSLISRGPCPKLELLIQLADLDWDDVRGAAAARLSEVDASRFDLPTWMLLIDSTREEVQAAARGLLTRHLDGMDTHELLSRLAQHPHPSMRGFVVDLAVGQLRPGFVRLAKMEPVFRAVLFDLHPDRKLRTRVLSFLVERGSCDAAQGQLAASILSDVVRSATHDVRERALRGLVELQLAHPELESPLRLEGAP
jgi:hypothetical protein